MQQQQEVSTLSTVELKSLAYDQMAQIELAQNNLRVINQELGKRLQPANQPSQPAPQYQPNWPPGQPA